MGTRSYIILSNDESYTAIYCHWDGYLEHNGRILMDHYCNWKKVLRLIDHGDLSVLKPKLAECEFYCRDWERDWEDCKPVSYPNLKTAVKAAENSGCEFVYHFDGKSWLYASRGIQCFGLSDGTPFSAFRPLAEGLAELEEAA